MNSIYSSHSDVVLARLLKLGDEKAFEEIYNRYFGVIYSFLCRMLRDDNQAEDMVQELFLALYENRTGVGIISLKAYLYQSARYALIDHDRRQKTHYNYISGMDSFLKSGTWSTEETVIQRDLEQQIEKEIQKLPSRMRDVFELSRKHYLSNKEIAAELHISEGTVRQQIHNALVRLRTSISCFILQFVMTSLWYIAKFF